MIKNLEEKFINFAIVFVMSFWSSLFTIPVERNDFLSIILLLLIYFFIFIFIQKKYSNKDIIFGIITFTIVNASLAFITYIKTIDDLTLIYNYFQVINYTAHIMFSDISYHNFRLFIVIAPIVTFLIHTVSYGTAYYFNKKRNKEGI